MSLQKRFLGTLILSSLLFATAFTQIRQELNIPDLPDYLTLKCDFHCHTVFSDGSVWPPERVEEAWREGLDVLAITDHVEYHTHEADIPVKQNRAYELALPRANELGLLLIPGAEITRSMPPGHLNALFIQDANPLTVKDPLKALEAAFQQNAFIFWNHPGWDGQQPDGVARWYPIHTEILEKGWLKGIEVANYQEYYPTVIDWALEKNLTMFGNSDVHGRVDFDFETAQGNHRPMTLVFAQARTLPAVREALEQRRTAAYFKDLIIGREEWLRPLFHACLKVKTSTLSQEADGTVRLQLQNVSDFNLKLVATETVTGYEWPKEITAYARSTVLIPIKAPKAEKSFTTLELPYTVANFQIAGDRYLAARLKIDLLSLNSLRFKPVPPGQQFRLEIQELPPEFQVFYSLDGTLPTPAASPASQPIVDQDSVRLTLAVFQGPDQIGEKVATRAYFHRALGKTVQLQNLPASKYFANGAPSLTDGLAAPLSYQYQNWLGFEGQDLVATIDFEREIPRPRVIIHVLQNLSAWIFVPKTLGVSISKNGTDFREISRKDLRDPRDYPARGIQKLVVDLKGQSARFLRVNLTNQGTCPDWHAGAGGKAWLFVDEIRVE